MGKGHTGATFSLENIRKTGRGRYKILYFFILLLFLQGFTVGNAASIFSKLNTN